jgi:Tfp pilus assembly protein FimV
VVAVPARAWRPLAGPAAFLAAVTLAVVGIRALWPHHAAKVAHPQRHHQVPALRHDAKKPPGRRFYHVRAGDTLAAIAVRTHIPVAELQRLNPTVKPTALFIGQRLRLR